MVGVFYCSAQIVHTEKILQPLLNTSTHIHTYAYTQAQLGRAKWMSSLQGFLSHPVVTFHPGSVSQAGRALSVTDPLDSSDKDEDDI